MKKNNRKIITTKTQGPKGARSVTTVTETAPVSKSARRRASKKKGLSIEVGGLDLGSLGKLKSGKLKIGREQTVGVAPHSMDIQMVTPRMWTENHPIYGEIQCIGGTEYVGSIFSGDEGNNPGDILATYLINPSAFPNTRLKQLSALFERYRFRELYFLYEPIANATVSGQLIGYADYDPDNIVVSNEARNVSTAAAHLGQKNVQVWETAVFPFGIVDEYSTLFTSTSGGEDPRLIYQGVYYLLASSTLPPATALGNIYLAYVLETYIPYLETVDVAPSRVIASLYCADETGDGSHFLGTSDLEGFILPPQIASFIDLTDSQIIDSNYGAAAPTYSVTLPAGQYVYVLSGASNANWVTGNTSTATVKMNWKNNGNPISEITFCSEAVTNTTANYGQFNSASGTGLGGFSTYSYAGMINVVGDPPYDLTCQPAWTYTNSATAGSSVFINTGITIFSITTPALSATKKVGAREFLAQQSLIRHNKKTDPHKNHGSLSTHIDSNPQTASSPAVVGERKAPKYTQSRVESPHDVRASAAKVVGPPDSNRIRSCCTNPCD